MTAIIDSLETPFLLVAMPQILDPLFNRSVVLVLEHHSEGCFGMIVNRPTDLAVQDLLEGMEITWGGAPDDRTWFGGPVQPNLGTLLFGEVDRDVRAMGRTVEICAGLVLSQDTGVLSAIASDPPDRFRMILGYAGWGPSQLEQEMSRNDWLIAPFDLDILFSPDTESIWRKTLASIGVRPESLPSVTRGGDGGGSN